MAGFGNTHVVLGIVGAVEDYKAMGTIWEMVGAFKQFLRLEKTYFHKCLASMSSSGCMVSRVPVNIR